MTPEERRARAQKAHDDYWAEIDQLALGRGMTRFNGTAAALKRARGGGEDENVQVVAWVRTIGAEWFIYQSPEKGYTVTISADGPPQTGAYCRWWRWADDVPLIDQWKAAISFVEATVNSDLEHEWSG